MDLLPPNLFPGEADRRPGRGVPGLIPPIPPVPPIVPEIVGEVGDTVKGLFANAETSNIAKSDPTPKLEEGGKHIGDAVEGSGFLALDVGGQTSI